LPELIKDRLVHINNTVQSFTISFGVFIPPACTSEQSANLFGFVVLPLAQPDVATIGQLTAICRAIGLRPVAFNRHDSNAEGSRKMRWLVSKDGRQMIVQVCFLFVMP
jgi:hypothetical protein